MIISKHLKTIVLLTAVGSFGLLCAAVKPPPFEIESGMITYDIRGSAQLTPETNLSVKGSATFHFKEWGEIKVEEVNGVVETQGAIEYKETVKRFEKETKDKIITADFENEQLLERKKSSIKKDIQSIQTNYLDHNGTETIAGLLCDVWEGVGVKKCIYKGIVLKLESHVYGVSYVKVATNVVFDINTSENCELPDYPVQQFGLFRGNIKTKNIFKTEKFCTVINDVASDIKENKSNDVVSHFGDQAREKFINRISRDIFEKKQTHLLQLLQTMKKMRECLQTVENPFEANQCIEHFSRMRLKLGNDENDYIILWDEKRKNSLLDKIEEEIIELESRIACVKRAKNITDLSTCMK